MSHFYSPDPCVALVVICILLSVLAAILLPITVVVLAVLYIHKFKKQKDETCGVEAEVCQTLHPMTLETSHFTFINRILYHHQLAVRLKTHMCDTDTVT